MKRRWMKLISMVLATVMVLSMSLTAFATTVSYTGDDAGSGIISIKGAVEGETYTLYKMLDLTYDSENQSYAYYVVEEWMEFFTEGAASTYFDVDETTGYVTIKDGVTLESDSSEMADLAKAAKAYAIGDDEENPNFEPMLTATADSGGVTFSNLPFGWYLVGTSFGALCSIDTVNETVTIDEKNTPPVPEKEEYDANTDDDYTTEDTAEIGDTINYKVFLTDVANSVQLVMHDEMSTGLTFQIDSVKVYYAATNSTDLYDDDDSIEWNDITGNTDIYSQENAPISDGCTFELYFDDAWLSGLASNTVIKITYDAVVNEDAVVEDELYFLLTNDVYLTYGDDSSSEKKYTYTDTVGFDLAKYDENENLLSGAEFELYRDEAHNDIVYFYTIYDENDETILGYDVATELQIAEETNITTTIVAGNVYIKGLHEGTYYLHETVAPDGYNLLTEDVKITITIELDEDTHEITSETISVDDVAISGDEVGVINNSGTELPSTGGSGTGMVYLFGAILAIGAGAVLVYRKRFAA